MKKTAVVGIAATILLAAGYFGLTGYYKKQITDQVDARLSQVKARYGLDIAYADLGVDLFSQSAVLSKVTARSGDSTVPIDSLRVYCVDDPGNAINFEAKGIDLSGEKDKALKESAYPSPDKADLRLDFAFDQASRLADLRSFNLVIANYFELDLTAQVIDPPSIASVGNMLRLMLELGDTQLSRAKLKYKDRDFLGHLVAQQAKKEGLSAEEVVARYRAELDSKIAKYEKSGSPEMAALLTAFKDFARDRKGIEIAVSPEAPVKIGKMPSDEREAIKLLRLRAVNL
jgi:hypothetical protein